MAIPTTKVPRQASAEREPVLVAEPALPLMEAFYTLQGEGAHTGRAAYFIRVGGCDVGCHWCDAKESWEATHHPSTPIRDIVAGAAKYPGRLAVVTGGEPLIYDMDPLTRALREAGFATNLETSGAYPLSGRWDWICFSPKKFKAAEPGIYAAADELKVIVYNESDFGFAERHAARVGAGCRLLLQPEWSRSDRMLPRIIDYVKDNPRWQISLQTHKFMNIP